MLGCSAAKYHEAADRDVYHVISKRERQLFGRSSLFNIDTPYADRAPEAIPPEEIIIERQNEGDRRLSLSDALGMAVANNREYQSAREQLYLSALELTGARHQFAFRLSDASDASVDLEASRSTDGGIKGSSDLSVTLNKAFKMGGQISASLANDLILYFDGKPKVPSVTLTLTQPLLRGAGAKMAAEVLTQAERSVVYEIRVFSHYQKTFAIGIVTDYFRLLQSKDSVRNSYRNYQNLKAARERAVAFAEAERLPRFQVDQARQKEFSARVSYLSDVEDYRAAEDDFKQQLNLPIGMQLILDDNELLRLNQQGMAEVPIGEKQGYIKAVANRLDVLNAIDQFEDSKRKVKVAANGLLPDLNLVADTELASQFYSSFDPGEFKQTAGIKLNLPLDRLTERNAFRSSRINFEKELRSLSSTLDELRGDIRRGIRNLAQEKEKYEIQQNALTLARQRVEVMALLLQAGQATIRDQLEAQADLVSAQNSVTRAMVNYHTARWNLLKNLGILDVENGKFWLNDLAGPAGDGPLGGNGALLEVVSPASVFGEE